MANIIFILITLFIVTQLRFVKGDLQYLDLPEGASCTWKGVDGVCTSVYRCLSAIEDIRIKDYPPVCSFHGVKTMICCTDCELGDLSKSLSLNAANDVWFFLTGEKARDNCLYNLQLVGDRCVPYELYKYLKTKHPTKNCYNTRLVIVAAAGGDDAERDQFRHMALLGYGTELDSAKWLCGGSLISNKFILTAGHCTSSPNIGPVRYVTLGILKRSDPLELWQRYHVKRIVRHPQYKPPSKYNDIALLETATEVSFNIHVLPACLQFVFNPNYENSAFATGWGALGRNRELADTLQRVFLDRFEKQECDRLYPRHRHLRHGFNHTTQMCYGNRQKVRDTCEGDSGGPLQDNRYLSECVYTITGVTSTGRTCGLPGNPGIYTRVMPYVPWIESIVWPDN